MKKILIDSRTFSMPRATWNQQLNILTIVYYIPSMWKQVSAGVGDGT